jgi:hypothetical protein
MHGSHVIHILAWLPVPSLAIAAAQIHSRRIFTHVHLKGAGSYNGDFIVSKLSPLVNRWAL